MFFYIHIPFCRQRCTYCKFALSPMVKEAQVNRYVAHLRKEIRGFFESGDREGDRIESVYFGGGTPSVLSPGQIADILSEFPADRFSPSAEICLEANPEDVTESWSTGVLRLGVNRISLGVQTLNPDSLAAIGRSRPESVGIALETLADAGHRNVNVDFILGLPHVRPGETLRDIRHLHEKFPDIRHTSVYFLEK
jgi:oxygen-independent coproporphyrinogen-3 oxidase